MRVGCYCMDCMEGMAQFPNDFFDLADPPYFSGPERRGYYGSKVSRIGVHRDYPVSPKWDVPGKEYFDELLRVSHHYIVWGCNYFDYQFAPGRIVWDKCNANTSFSDCEIAATNLFSSVRLFRFMWNGMMQGKSIAEGYIMQGNKALKRESTRLKSRWRCTTGYSGSMQLRDRESSTHILGAGVAELPHTTRVLNSRDLKSVRNITACRKSVFKNTPPSRICFIFVCRKGEKRYEQSCPYQHSSRVV